MDASSNLKLPFIASNQAQKHVTFNEAVRALDALVQLSVLDRTLTEPPAGPAEGARHLVAAGASGDWAGRDGEIAAFQDGVWAFYAPREGWIAWVAEEEAALVWDGGEWRGLAPAEQGINPAALVGVNTTADALNRLAVKSDAALFSHDDATPGSGDMRLTVNKASAPSTGSLVFQSDWAGKAELGLAGSDDFRIRVSPDGSTWTDALIIDAATGEVTLPETTLVGGGGGAAAAGAAPFNLFQDAGRFAGAPEAQGTAAVAFVQPPYATPINGNVYAAGPKFIHNNSTFGGAGAALDPDVATLTQAMRPGAASGILRFGIEFFLMDVTAGAGTAVPLTVDSVTHYLAMANPGPPLPPIYTLNYWVLVKSGTVVPRVETSNQMFINGVEQTVNQAFDNADGWLQITRLYDIPPNLYLGYNSQMWPLYATPGAEFYFAAPFLTPGHVPIDAPTRYGVIPSLEAWR